MIYDGHKVTLQKQKHSATFDCIFTMQIMNIIVINSLTFRWELNMDNEPDYKLQKRKSNHTYH